jgi:hypothetical protein
VEGCALNKAVTPKQLELTADKITETSAAHGDLMEGVSETPTPLLATAGPPKDNDYDDFDWANDPAVILHEQRATAVYQNKFGGIVIRQERAWDEESDPYVVICAENAVTFMEALAKRARE